MLFKYTVMVAYCKSHMIGIVSVNWPPISPRSLILEIFEQSAEFCLDRKQSGGATRVIQLKSKKVVATLGHLRKQLFIDYYHQLNSQSMDWPAANLMSPAQSSPQKDINSL